MSGVVFEVSVSGFVSSRDGATSLSFLDEEESVVEALAGLRYASSVLLDIASCQFGENWVYIVSVLYLIMNQFNQVENSEMLKRDATRLTMMSRIDNLISGKGNSRHDRALTPFSIWGIRQECLRLT